MEKCARFDGSTWATFAQEDTKLPKTGIGVMHGDRSGNVWFGTDGAGIVCYNGVSWMQYAPGDSIRAIAEDREGTVWFGTNRGLTRFDGVTWRTWTKEDGLTGNDVQSVRAAPDGRIWFISDGMLEALMEQSSPRIPHLKRRNRCFRRMFTAPSRWTLKVWCGRAR